MLSLLNRLLAWLVGAVVAVLALLFAWYNTALVTVSLKPLPFDITVPVFMLALGMLVIGLFAGMLLAWMMGAHRRRTRSRQAQRIRSLEAEVHDLRRTQTDTLIRRHGEVHDGGDQAPARLTFRRGVAAGADAA